MSFERHTWVCAGPSCKVLAEDVIFLPRDWIEVRWRETHFRLPFHSWACVAEYAQVRS